MILIDFSELLQNLIKIQVARFFRKELGLVTLEKQDNTGSEGMAARDRSFRNLLQWLIAGTRGGVNRARIIMAIREEPKNANQLESLLGVDYRTIRHHLDILEINGLVTSMGQRYGKMYFLSYELEENFEVFEEIWNKIGKRLKKNDIGLK